MPSSRDASPAVRRQYDGWAAVYDRIWRRYVRQTTEALWRAARPRPGERVLDVGAGTGAFAERLLRAQPQPSYTGVDLSPRMVATARRKLGHAAPEVRFLRADAVALPFAGASFDVVVSASALHYFPDPGAALREMARVLRPGGRLALLDWCRDFWWMRLLGALLTWLDPAHHKTYTAEEASGLLKSAGFEAPSAERFRAGRGWGLMSLTAERRTAPHEVA